MENLGESVTALDNSIKARMTCIGQGSPDVLPDHVHILCTHQSIRQNFPVRSKSYSAVYCCHPEPPQILSRLWFLQGSKISGGGDWTIQARLIRWLSNNFLVGTDSNCPFFQFS